MKRGLKRPFEALVLLAVIGLASLGIFGLVQGHSARAADGEAEAAQSEEAAEASKDFPSNVAEARGRARLLHEAIHGMLQVVHRDFFREDEKLSIPSESFEDVFQELARSQKVEIRWLAVDTEAMNVDHKPTSDFEKAAVKVLRSGKTEFEAVTANTYRHVGTITLSAHCLKCHLPARSSNKDRAAGLAISMPLKKPAP